MSSPNYSPGASPLLLIWAMMSTKEGSPFQHTHSISLSALVILPCVTCYLFLVPEFQPLMSSSPVCIGCMPFFSVTGCFLFESTCRIPLSPHNISGRFLPCGYGLAPTTCAYINLISKSRRELQTFPPNQKLYHIKTKEPCLKWLAISSKQFDRRFREKRFQNLELSKFKAHGSGTPKCWTFS